VAVSHDKGNGRASQGSKAKKQLGQNGKRENYNKIDVLSVSCDD
jgi:hypothetical protein